MDDLRDSYILFMIAISCIDMIWLYDSIGYFNKWCDVNVFTYSYSMVLTLLKLMDTWIIFIFNGGMYASFVFYMVGRKHIKNDNKRPKA